MFFIYILKVSVILFSYLLNYNNEFFTVWLCLAIFSTIFNYFWDLKVDWGLLEKGSKNIFLRNQL